MNARISSHKVEGLEGILQRCFACNKPFLKSRRLVMVEKDGQKTYEYFTKRGAKAYDKLIDTVYALENIGAIPNADDAIEELDEIVMGAAGRG